MHKVYFILFFLTFFTTKASSQKVNYERDFEKAKKLSQTQNKPLFVVFDISFDNKVMPKLPDALKDFNTKITKPTDVLEKTEVANQLNKNFINYKINYEPNLIDPEVKELVQEYKISSFPVFVFIDSKGGLLLKEDGSKGQYQLFLEVIDKALQASKQKSIIDYDEQFANGNYDKSFLKEYIDRRKVMGNYDNAKLIEKYVTFLSVKDLNSYDEVVYILQGGPYLDGIAYKLAFTNRGIIDSIYKNEPLKERTAFNNRIIANSFNDAVSNKSIVKANLVSNFVRNTWSNNYKEGSKQSVYKMVQYYFAIKDYDNYLKQASFYYDQYYMNVNADSIKKQESLWAEKTKNELIKLKQPPVKFDSSTTIVKRVTRFTTIGSNPNNYANELNNAAYNFYLTKTKNTTYLTKAMLWSKKSIELSETAAYYDTLAHLVYALGFYSEAEALQEKAIDLAITEKENRRPFEAELGKMKNRSL